MKRTSAIHGFLAVSLLAGCGSDSDGGTSDGNEGTDTSATDGSDGPMTSGMSGSGGPSTSDGGTTGGGSGSGTGDSGTGDSGTGDSGTGDSGGETDTGGEGSGDPNMVSGTRLRRRYFEADGGAELSVDFWDSDLETPCEFGTAADGETRCLPSRTESVYYLNADCTGPVIELRTCERAWGAEVEPATSCGETRRSTMFRANSTVATPGDQIYYRSGGNCQGFFAQPDTQYVEAETVSSVEFVAAQVETSARAGRLEVRTYVADDGARQTFETRDTERDTACTVEKDHCLPTDRYNALNRYSDASCTDRLWGGPPTTYPCPTSLIVQSTFVDGCPTQTRYFDLGDPVDADPVYYLNVDVCTEQTPSPTERYWSTGTERILADFPAVGSDLEGNGRLRLRRPTDDAGDPIPTFQSSWFFWDTELDAECRIVQQDGQFRCLPMGTMLDYVEPFNTYYADSGCGLTRLVERQACTTPGDLVALYGDSVCDVPNVWQVDSVYERGEAVTGDTVYRYRDPNCEEVERTWDMYTLGDPVAADTLPAVTFHVE